jgi:hypothetical protein
MEGGDAETASPQGMKKGDAGRASPRTRVGKRGAGDETHPPGSEAGSTSSGNIRRTERTTHNPQGLTGPGLIRLLIRGRNEGLESHLQDEPNVVYESLKPSIFKK